MVKQKICVLGAGLSGLLTAYTLSQKNFEIDIYDPNFFKSKSTNRTTGISNDNFIFLKKFKVFLDNNSIFWPIKEIKIYEGINIESSVETLKFRKKNKNIFFIVNNDIFKEKILKKILNSKNIKIKKKFNIFNYNKFFNSKKIKYNLFINCTGPHSKFSKRINLKSKIVRNYNAISLTSKINHKPVTNNTAIQFFLKEGPLALLPVSKTQTSIVWSVKKKYLFANKNKFTKSYIKKILERFYHITSMQDFNFNELKYYLSLKYYDHRLLNFGDVLHQVHPFAGQGFNMIIRDLQTLHKILNYNSNLGLDIGSKIVLKEFSDKKKYKNYIFATGLDILNKTFSYNKESFSKIRKLASKKINQNSFLKDIIIKLADEGIN